jgi:hypothetical protein
VLFLAPILGHSHILFIHCQLTCECVAFIYLQAIFGTNKSLFGVHRTKVLEEIEILIYLSWYQYQSKTDIQYHLINTCI